MSIATEELQAQMLAIGEQLFELAGSFADSQGAVVGDDRISAVGQVLMQGALGHCEARGLNLSIFVYGAAYAVGSLTGQISCDNARYVLTALTTGLKDGQASAFDAFAIRGQA